MDVPHIRGDEPQAGFTSSMNVEMFPTFVGMNRTFNIASLAPLDVPHIRGDEPKPKNSLLPSAPCSPQSWG